MKISESFLIKNVLESPQSHLVTGVSEVVLYITQSPNTSPKQN